MALAKTILVDFFTYAARYWILLLLLTLIYLVFHFWDPQDKGHAGLTSNANILDCFFRQGYQLEDDIFQGRLGAEFVLSKFGVATLVQIKWWHKPIGAAQVQEISASRRKLYCKFAIVINKEGFTRAARREAAIAGVWLLDFYNLEAELARFSAGQDQGLRSVAAAGDS